MRPPSFMSGRSFCVKIHPASSKIDSGVTADTTAGHPAVPQGSEGYRESKRQTTATTPKYSFGGRSIY